MAIVVGDPWQNQGLGRALATALADAARAVGIRRFAATMLGDNEPARRLMRTFAMRLQEGVVSGGVREVLVELAA
jgi:RimJ/RimL family protein N-acetyltransferase